MQISVLKQVLTVISHSKKMLCKKLKPIHILPLATSIPLLLLIRIMFLLQGGYGSSNSPPAGAPGYGSPNAPPAGAPRQQGAPPPYAQAPPPGRQQLYNQPGQQYGHPPPQGYQQPPPSYGQSGAGGYQQGGYGGGPPPQQGGFGPAGGCAPQPPPGVNQELWNWFQV